jgi:hypothetical protein
MTPFSYTDPQNHRVELLAAIGPRRPYVLCQAENLAPGGDTVTVCLPTAEARTLVDRLNQQAPYEFTDQTGAMLRVEPADDWTRFTFVREARQEDGQSDTVPVVILTGRLPEVASALRAEVGRAEDKQHDPEDRAQYCAGAAIDHDETGVCNHSPSKKKPAPPVVLTTLLAHVAAHLPTPDVAPIALTALTETLLADDLPADEQQATAAARYLLARHARELSEMLRAKAGRHGARSYDYETGPGMHTAAEQLAKYADRLDGGKPPGPVAVGQ